LDCRFDLQSGKEIMTIQSCTVGDTEIQFVPSPTADSQTIRIAATTFGMHLAQLLGATQRDGPFFVLPHSAEVDHTLRELIDALIAARYHHPLLLQLRLNLDTEVSQ
jgi:hypothetical protein